jgi:hypothetical protein
MQLQDWGDKTDEVYSLLQWQNQVSPVNVAVPGHSCNIQKLTTFKSGMV